MIAFTIPWQYTKNDLPFWHFFLYRGMFIKRVEKSIFRRQFSKMFIVVAMLMEFLNLSTIKKEQSKKDYE